MLRVNFNSRILCDTHFMEYTLKNENKIPIIQRLMRIKSVSEDYKGEHNVILDFDFKDVLMKRLTKEHFIRAAFKEVPTPDFLEDGDDDITKRIIYSIWLANKKPYNLYIFTSPEMEKEYNKNKHIEGMSSVKVKSGNDALEIINNFYRQFTLKREMSH